MRYLLPKDQEVDESFEKSESYKIANFYRLSDTMYSEHYIPLICEKVSRGETTLQHESVIKELIENLEVKFHGLDTRLSKWVELDDVSDLEYAKALFL